MPLEATLDEFVLAQLIQGWPDTITLDIPEDRNDEDAMHDLREALRDRLEELVEEGDGVAHAALHA
jgi:hypothetical protein